MIGVVDGGNFNFTARASTFLNAFIPLWRAVTARELQIAGFKPANLPPNLVLKNNRRYISGRSFDLKDC